MITVCAKGRTNILSLWGCACFCWHCAGGYSSGVRLTCITAVPLHQKNDWKNTLPLRSIGCTLLTTLGFLMYHIRGKTGGKPQVLFPHIALNQRVVFIFGHENFPSLIIRRVSLMVMPDTAVAPLHPALNFIEVTAIYLFL